MAAPLTLYAPQAFINATPEQRASVSNGCGPSGWKLAFLSNYLFGLNIAPACDIHDWMYAFGETEDQRNEADRVFRNNMLRIIVYAGGGKFIRFLRCRKAKHYYKLVHDFGSVFYWDGKIGAVNEYIIEPRG